MELVPRQPFSLKTDFKDRCAGSIKKAALKAALIYGEGKI